MHIVSLKLPPVTLDKFLNSLPSLLLRRSKMSLRDVGTTTAGRVSGYPVWQQTPVSTWSVAWSEGEIETFVSAAVAADG